MGYLESKWPEMHGDDYQDSHPTYYTPPVSDYLIIHATKGILPFNN